MDSCRFVSLPHLSEMPTVVEQHEPVKSGLVRFACAEHCGSQQTVNLLSSMVTTIALLMLTSHEPDISSGGQTVLQRGGVYYLDPCHSDTRG